MEVELLELFVSDILRQVLHQILELNPTVGEGRGACAFEGSVLCLARLDARVATVVGCLVE